MSNCGNCSSCGCGKRESLTGSFSSAEGEGFALFLNEVGGIDLGSEDDFFWSLAVSQIPIDPSQPTDVWEKKVAERFSYLKEVANQIEEG